LTSSSWSPAAGGANLAPVLDSQRLPGPGARVGDYVIERALGRGGMGAVFVARHRDVPVRRALKVLLLRDDGGREGIRRERFAREARALAKVDRHPGVVGIHDYGITPAGLAYCALDLVEGGDLEGLLEREAPLPLEQALTLAAEVARALDHVHRAGIVHRDLKPANVLLAPVGSSTAADDGRARVGWRPVLTDFGLARDDAEAQRLTRSRAILGTPYYMAPEQVSGRSAGPPADVFALGAILYQALTGALPFAADSLPGLYHAVMETDPLPPSARRRGLPGDLDAVVLRALAKEPDDRPTAAELADALETLGSGSSVAWRRPPQRRPPRRRLAAAGLAAAALLTAGVIAIAGRPGEAPLAAALAEARAARRSWSATYGPRLVGRDPSAAEAEALAEARADLAGADDPVARAEVERLDAALALERVRADLAAGDLAAAESRLAGRAGPEAGVARAALLAARHDAAALDALADAPAPRPEVLLVAARLAREEGRLERAAALCALPGSDPRDRDLAAAVRAERAAVAAARAVRAAAALAADAAAEHLAAACAADPAAADRHAADVVAAALAAPPDEPRATARCLDAVADARPGAPLPPAAAPAYAAAAEAARRASDWAAVRRYLEAAFAADPDYALPAAAANSLFYDAGDLRRRGRHREALELMALVTRTGWVDAVSDGDLARVSREGLLDALVTDRPDDWVGYYYRARAAIRLAEPALREPAVADLDRVLAADGVHPAVRTDARLRRLQLLADLDPAGHLARIEAALARGFPDPHRLLWLGAAYGPALDRPELAADYAVRHLEALERRVEETMAGAVPAGGRAEEHINELDRARLRVAELAIAGGRLAEAEPLVDQLESRGFEPARLLLTRARLLEARGRPEEALAALEAAIAAGRPLGRHVRELRRRLREALGR